MKPLTQDFRDTLSIEVVKELSPVLVGKTDYERLVLIRKLLEAAKIASRTVMNVDTRELESSIDATIHDSSIDLLIDQESPEEEGDTYERHCDTEGRMERFV